MSGTRKHSDLTWVDRRYTSPADSFSVSSLQNSLRVLSEASPYVGPTFPGTPREGDVWIDTTKNIVQVYFGGWQGLGGAADVRAYGAKGDGVTDDAAALQAAVNAVSLAGGELHLVAGATYLVRSAVLVPSSVYIYGHGPRTTIKNDNHMWYPMVQVADTATDVRLFDILLDGGGKPGPFIGLGKGSCGVGLERIRYRNLGTPIIEGGLLRPGSDRALFVDPLACPPEIVGGDTGEPPLVPFTAWRQDVETTSLWVRPTLAYGGTYQPGDYVGPSGPNGITCSPATNVPSGGGTLTSLTVIDSDNQGVPLDVYVFSDWGIDVPTDNTPWQIPPSGARHCCGLIQVPSYLPFGAVAGQFGFGVFPQGPIAYQCHLAELYLAIVTRGAPTYSLRGLDLRLGLHKDTP